MIAQPERAERTRHDTLRLPGGSATQIYDWVRGSPTGLVFLALIVGVGAGLGAIVFRYLILWFTQMFSGHADYSATGRATHPFFSGAPNPHLPWLGIGFVVLAPAVGGLIYGPLIDRFAREARGHGVPEVMLAVAVVKSLASALCIGSGGSVGREGPIVQIGSALGSTLGQAVRLPESRLRLLVACGAAGGISATFNAPIAGVFFGLELILRDFQTESFGVVVLSSITAAVIGRAAFGSQAFLTLPDFHIVSYWEYLLYAVLGLLAAGVGVGFARVLYAVEDAADRVWHGPEWARPAVGGLLLGLLLLALPQMYGVGYPVLENGIRGDYVVWFLLLLMVAKMIATSLTIAIGGSGGVFAPSLFIGAMLGTAFGMVVHSALPTLTAPAGAYGLVGMGAVFAGAARAPITAVIIIFELTGDYTIILPLMASIVLATGVSKGLSRDTIYTLKLRRRGIDIMRGRAANLMEVLTVADAMQSLERALGLLVRDERLGLPVLAADNRRVVGWVTHRDVLRAYNARLEQSVEQAEQQGGGSAPGTQAPPSAAGNGTDQRLAGPAEVVGGESLLGRLRDYRIVDLEIAREQAGARARIRDVPWPPSTLVVAIRRGPEAFTPTARPNCARAIASPCWRPRDMPTGWPIS